MQETTLKIGLAALCHDIGKFVEGGMKLPTGYADANQQIYQPVWDSKYSHRHALYSAAFIEHYAEYLPAVCNQPGWGDGDSFINLAACHHKPETPMQSCITQADRLSAGLDRATYEQAEYIPFQRYRSTRMVSILEALSPDEDRQNLFEKDENYTTNYSLAPLTPESIFPTAREKIDTDKAKHEYQAIFDEFIKRLAILPHKDDPALWGQHFDSLLAHFCSHIPADRVGAVARDVSLYDHCRTTAALAAALYLYHHDTDSLDEQAIEKVDVEKFLLVSGDFYGIQEFIFTAGEHQRLRAKLLRGRSFAVSLLSELAAESLCTALGLPFTAVFLSAAGKFHILAANTPDARQTIEDEARRLNRWLFDISYGQASVGIIITTARPSEFTKEQFFQLWDRHLEAMEKRKHQRLDTAHYGEIGGYLDSFTKELGLCPFCEKRPAQEITENDTYLGQEGKPSCAVCRDHIMLGTNLVKNRFVALYRDHYLKPGRETLLEPLYGRYQVTFFDTHAPQRDPSLIKFWQYRTTYETDPSTSTGLIATIRLLNGYIPVYGENDSGLDLTGEDDHTNIDDLIAAHAPKTFNDLAKLAKSGKQGAEALGILKADVDNLGLLMSCGMAQQRFTMSRMATLSRKIDQFFSLYLPHQLACDPGFQNVYTVFAGGDDLFLIGPWNVMPKLASHLRKAWGRYVSGNDGDNQLTFSAGISLQKTHVPVNRLAVDAETALERAKDGGRNRITMFGETVTWDEFEQLLAHKETISHWQEKQYITSGMLYRLNTFIDMARKQRAITGATNSVNIRDMECLKWPALLRYSLERNIKTKEAEKDRAMQEVIEIKEWIEDYGGALRIALWSKLYEQR